MAGIVEIAKRAGVSPATVSRALRGLHHVNERTREKIVEAAQHFDYPIRPDLLPRTVGVRRNTIGVIAPYLSRWYFSQAVAGAEQALREAGMDLLLYNFAQVDARQRVFQQKKLVGKVDGLIVMSLPPTEREFDQILGIGIPVALLGVDDKRCSSVFIDDVHGAETAAQHLIEMGHREIAVMGGPMEMAFNFKVSTNRITGFRRVLEESDLNLRKEFELTADFDVATAELVMDEFLRRKKLPTAIFCHSDEMAFGVLRSLKKKGLRVPEDISVIGYDNHDYAEHFDLDTISQPVQFLGQLAASQILASIEKPESRKAQIKVPTQLVARGSVANIN